MPIESGFRKGRGAGSNPEGRFESRRVEAIDDGWPHELADELPPLETTVTAEHARQVITRNNSPDIPFEQSINAYRGCEHGCVYCYARPSHSYMNLSPGLDFETKLFYKADAARLLEAELAKPGYSCKPINLGANTDPYQPIERKLQVTRSFARGAAAISTSAHHCHQVGAGGAGHRYSRGHGTRWPGLGPRQHHDTR